LPSKDEHLTKAAHNERLAATLSSGQYLDWAATAFFYAALHYIILAVQGDHPDKHDDRDSLIGRHPNLKRVYKEYRALKTMSRNARYYAVQIDQNDIHVVKQHFDVLSSYVKTILGVKDLKA
jgi:hypothetical protein